MFLGKQKLNAKFSKCEFWLTLVAFLGYVVSKEGVMVDPQKIEAVKNWVRPSFVNEIRSFVGLASHYCRLWYELNPIGISRSQLVSQQSEPDVVVTTEGPQAKKIGIEKVPIGIWPYGCCECMDV